MDIAGIMREFAGYLEFGSEVNIQMADDRFNEEPRWISLFPQDNI